MSKFKNKFFRKKPERDALFARLIAKSIDLFLILILSLFFYPFGVILSIIYMSLSDSIQGGQSVGKKLIGFKVVSLKDGKVCGSRQSFIRNLPILFPLFFAIFPFFGWFLCFSIGLPLIAIELYFLFRIDSGHRLGDAMADTTVIADDPNRVDLKLKTQKWFEKTGQSNLT
jgi:hypothetical protein